MKQTNPGFAVRTSSLRAIALLMGSALLAGGESSVAQERFESPPTFQASKILPADILSGPNHRVDERVANDGVMNLYTIDSPFSAFTANSNTELWIRVGEIDAIAKLVEVSRSEQFAKGVGKAGQDVLAVASGALIAPMLGSADSSSSAFTELSTTSWGPSAAAPVATPNAATITAA